jgi:hypothetical protein
VYGRGGVRRLGRVEHELAREHGGELLLLAGLQQGGVQSLQARRAELGGGGGGSTAACTAAAAALTASAAAIAARTLDSASLVIYRAPLAQLRVHRARSTHKTRVESRAREKQERVVVSLRARALVAIRLL